MHAEPAHNVDSLGRKIIDVCEGRQTETVADQFRSCHAIKKYRNKFPNILFIINNKIIKIH